MIPDTGDDRLRDRRFNESAPRTDLSCGEDARLETEHPVNHLFGGDERRRAPGRPPRAARERRNSRPNTESACISAGMRQPGQTAQRPPSVKGRKLGSRGVIVLRREPSLSRNPNDTKYKALNAKSRTLNTDIDTLLLLPGRTQTMAILTTPEFVSNTQTFPQSDYGIIITSSLLAKWNTPFSCNHPTQPNSVYTVHFRTTSTPPFPITT